MVGKRQPKEPEVAALATKRPEENTGQDSFFQESFTPRWMDPFTAALWTLHSGNSPDAKLASQTAATYSPAGDIAAVSFCTPRPPPIAPRAACAPLSFRASIPPRPFLLHFKPLYLPSKQRARLRMIERAQRERSPPGEKGSCWACLYGRGRIFSPLRKPAPSTHHPYPNLQSPPLPPGRPTMCGQR